LRQLSLAVIPLQGLPDSCAVTRRSRPGYRSAQARSISVMRQAEEFRLGGRFKEEMPPGLGAVFEVAFAIPGLLLGVG
jgi:hypothetical protein